MECFFGILKKRFMILKNPRMLLNNSKKIRNVVICCCIHNILLLYDVCVRITAGKNRLAMMMLKMQLME